MAVSIITSGSNSTSASGGTTLNIALTIPEGGGSRMLLAFAVMAQTDDELGNADWNGTAMTPIGPGTSGVRGDYNRGGQSRIHAYALANPETGSYNCGVNIPLGARYGAVAVCLDGAVQNVAKAISDFQWSTGTPTITQAGGFSGGLYVNCLAECNSSAPSISSSSTTQILTQTIAAGAGGNNEGNSILAWNDPSLGSCSPNYSNTNNPTLFGCFVAPVGSNVGGMTVRGGITEGGVILV